MKKILKKIYICVFFCVGIVAMQSCDNIVDEDTGGSPRADGAALLRVTVGDNARTILPESLELQSLSFELFGAADGNQEQRIAEWKTSDAMNSDVSIIIGQGTWDFTLYALKQGVRMAEGRLRGVGVSAGENSLHFILQSYEQGSGSLSVVLSYPADEIACTVCAGLFTPNGETVPGYEMELCADSTSTAYPAILKAEYKKESVPAGTYLLKFFLYQDGVEHPINTYCEAVRIVSGCVSRAECVLENRNAKHTLTYKLNGGSWQDGAVIPLSFSEYAQTMLPAADCLKRENMIFTGWYTDSDCSGERIMTIPADTESDITLYAGWGHAVSATDFNDLEHIFSKLYEKRSASFTISLTDKNPDMQAVVDVFSKISNENILITLDLSLCTELTSLENISFQRCNVLERIILPDSMADVPAGNFAGCLNLKGIYVGSGNNAYCTKDGVLFSKNGETLVVYPAEKRDTYYGVPAGTRTIWSESFFGCGNLTEVQLPESLETVKTYAFYLCNIRSVNIPPRVSSIDQNAFVSCLMLADITVDSANMVYTSENGVLFTKDKKNLVFYPIGKKQPAYTVPAGTEEIQEYAFCDCDALTEIMLPVSIKKIYTQNFPKLQTIRYEGTEEQWQQVEKDNLDIPDSVVIVYGSSAAASAF